LANTVFKLRRSSVAGKSPNTSTLSIGELAINLTDRKLYSSDGSNIFETGSNLTSLSVFSDITVGNSTVNSSINSTSFSGTSNNSNFVKANTGIVSNSSGVFVNSAYINTISSNSAAFLSGNAVTTNSTVLSVGSNVTVNTSSLLVGNSTVNTTISNGNISINGNNISPVQSFRNKIINGNFDYWQRGTSVTGVSNDQYLADRWKHFITGTTANVSRQSFTLGQTNVPNEPTYFHRTVVTSVAGAGNFCVLAQQVESVRTLAGQTATLSFWAKADASKNIAVEFEQSFGSGGSPSSAISAINVTLCALTTSWQKFTITVNIPSISGKTLGSDNNDKFHCNFWFDAGSTFNSRTNSLGQQSGTFDIAQVQLEAGSVATPFEVRPLGVELALCQRYYHTTMVHMQSPAASAMLVPIYFPVEMRSTPTTININAGSTAGGTSSVTLGVRDKRTAYFQFIASGAGNYYLDRIDAYNAEL
jgi:hypothetical protein